jgi:hypothetical protein
MRVSQQEQRRYRRQIARGRVILAERSRSGATLAVILRPPKAGGLRLVLASGNAT